MHSCIYTHVYTSIHKYVLTVVRAHTRTCRHETSSLRRRSSSPSLQSSCPEAAPTSPAGAGAVAAKALRKEAGKPPGFEVGDHKGVMLEMIIAKVVPAGDFSSVRESVQISLHELMVYGAIQQLKGSLPQQDWNGEVK